MQEGYVYIGEHYDILGRPLGLTDKKIGLTKDPISRQSNWSKTKSPILYRHIEVFKVDDMNRVEKLIHAILNSRNTNGEWFEDEDDTLVNDFCNFMEVYGGQSYKEECVNCLEQTKDSSDERLLKIVSEIGETELIRNYLGQNYDVTLTQNGKLKFMGEEYDTPNLCYNKGIVKHVKGVRGHSGTNGLNQFIIKETGQRLGDAIMTTKDMKLFINDEKFVSNFDYEYIIEVVKLAVDKIGLNTLISSTDIVKKTYYDFPENVLKNYGSSIKQIEDYHILTWGNKKHKTKKIKEIIEIASLNNLKLK